MPELEIGTYKPRCNLAHELVNKLTAIVGHCDLMEDHAAEDPECQKRLEAIREIAKGMAETLATHQCELDDLIREEGKKPRTKEFSAATQVRLAAEKSTREFPDPDSGKQSLVPKKHTQRIARLDRKQSTSPPRNIDEFSGFGLKIT